MLTLRCKNLLTKVGENRPTLTLCQISVINHGEHINIVAGAILVNDKEICVVILCGDRMYQDLFPEIVQPEVFVYKMNGLWFDSSHNLISKADIDSMLKNERELFIKQATESDGGHGVFYYNRNQNFWSLVEKIEGDIVVQRAVKQHKCLRDLNSSSVNTIRVLSLLTLE